MREPRPQSQSLKARGLSKVTVLVPEASAEGLRQFARELCRRQETGATLVGGQWRKLSPSAELMVDPERGARCAIRDTGAPGEGRYHWTVTVFGETDPVAGRTGELGKARSQAEGALLAYVEGGNDGPWALSWRLCRFLPTVGMRELLTQRDGHLCYGFVVQCRDRGRVRTDNLLGPGWQIERQDHLLTGARRCAYRITPAAR